MTIKNNIFWMYFSSPKHFYPFAGKLIPWFGGLAIILTLVGLYQGLIMLPEDFKQGDSYRIIFIHVPAAWMGMLIYFVMATYAIIGLVWNIKMSDIMASSLAPTGAMFTFLALWTGAFWGKPTWGAYWVWDARLTSYLILLFLYIGYMALQGAIEDTRRASRASAVLAIVGVVNLPIIYFSVKWWNTLHQGSSVTPTSSKMAASMLTTMMIMTFAFWMYAIAVVLIRARSQVLEREKQTAWVEEMVGNT
ncbi:MAG: heme ABC transporter permease CcmC [Thiohalomonadales bacterium]